MLEGGWQTDHLINECLKNNPRENEKKNLCGNSKETAVLKSHNSALQREPETLMLHNNTMCRYNSDHDGHFSLSTH